MEKERLNGVCYICGHDLEWNPDADNCSTEDLDDFIYEEIVCPECGAIHRTWIPTNSDEEEEVVPNVGDQGFGNCFHCGGTLVWSGDFMRSDYEGELDQDDDSIVRNLTCGSCGCMVEVVEPSENEMKSGKYPHWKNDESN